MAYIITNNFSFVLLKELSWIVLLVWKNKLYLMTISDVAWGIPKGAVSIDIILTWIFWLQMINCSVSSMLVMRVCVKISHFISFFPRSHFHHMEPGNNTQISVFLGIFAVNECGKIAYQLSREVQWSEGVSVFIFEVKRVWLYFPNEKDPD